MSGGEQFLIVNCPIKPEDTDKDTLRMFLSVCAAQDLSVHVFDVTAAFLQASLCEKIFLRAPPGYTKVSTDGEEMVLRLSKAIYGLIMD